MYHPKYKITDHILNLISQIEVLRTQVNSCRILPEREAELYYRSTVEATHSSTSIEGNPLNLKQVQSALRNKNPLTRRRYAEIEARNYHSALDWIARRKDSRLPLSVEDILTLHGIITKGLLTTDREGSWRQNPVYIEDQSGTITYEAAPVAAVPQLVSDLVAWLNGHATDLHPVIAAAILHFQLIAIHPFADSNGRTSRALTSLYLGLRDYDFRSSLVLDTYYSTDRPAYYHALSAQGRTYTVAERSDLTPWLSYFTEGFLTSAKVLSAETAILSSLSGEGDASSLSRDEMELLNYVEQFSTITITEAEDILWSSNRRTVQRRLRHLVELGLLRKSGTTKSAKYFKNSL